MFDIVSFIPRAVMQAVPLMLGCTGETITEKSGNLNLGTAGVMYVGGICGVIGAFLYENSGAEMNGFLTIAIPLLCCIVGSLLMGLLYCFLTVTLSANQNVTGLALTTFGVGIGNFFGGSLIKLVKTDIPSIVLSRTSLAFTKAVLCRRAWLVRKDIPLIQLSGICGDNHRACRLLRPQPHAHGSASARSGRKSRHSRYGGHQCRAL